MDTYSQFLDALADLPWLENLGQTNPRDSLVCRIYDWQTWLGPEDSAVALMMDYAVHWQTQLEESVADSDALAQHWDPIETEVLALVRQKVPYDPEQDPWYAPNAAVWSAAWYSALVGCWLWHFEALSKPCDHGETSSGLLNQWRLACVWDWFAAGHWPCSFYWSYDTGREDAVRMSLPKILVVY